MPLCPKCGWETLLFPSGGFRCLNYNCDYVAEVSSSPPVGEGVFIPQDDPTAHPGVDVQSVGDPDSPHHFWSRK